jgi:peptide/nickel transport system ATP-binding protein
MVKEGRPGACLGFHCVGDRPAARPGARRSDRRAEPLLDVRALTVRFSSRGGWLRARRSLSTPCATSVLRSWPAGETLALVGESGCGKTTTGKAIVQLLRGRAQIQGQALLDGRDLFAAAR